MPDFLAKSFLGNSPLGFHRVAYTEWGKTTARPPVICVHGLTRNGRDFDWLAKDLQSSTRIICPDVVGRGKSAWLAEPKLYSYPQYIADMATLIARVDAATIDWVGTSMGGIIGIFLAAMPNSPIRRLVINDVGPFIPMAALKRIASYVGKTIAFPDLASVEKYLRTIYAPFGITDDKDWKALTENSTRILPDGQLALAHDPQISSNFEIIDKDVDFWPIYDQIKCPVLVLHGEVSDILSHETAEAMATRGPKAKTLEFQGIGHAPALIDNDQIQAIKHFLEIA